MLVLLKTCYRKMFSWLWQKGQASPKKHAKNIKDFIVEEFGGKNLLIATFYSNLWCRVQGSVGTLGFLEIKIFIKLLSHES